MTWMAKRLPLWRIICVGNGRRMSPARDVSPGSEIQRCRSTQGEAAMGNIAKLAAVTAAAALFAAPAAAQRVQAGTRACGISGGIGFIIGSQRTLNCSFTSALPGPVEFYIGTLTKLG